MLAFLAPILDESPESLAAYRRAPEPVQPVPKVAAMQSEGGAVAVAGAEADAPQRQPIGPAVPPPAQKQQQQPVQYAEGLVDSEADDAELGAAAAPAAAQHDIGVAHPPPNQQQQQQQQEKPQRQEAEADREEEVSAPRRVVGPTMPSAAILAAAAAMKMPPEEEEEEEELLVGPPPPELAEEVDLGEQRQKDGKQGEGRVAKPFNLFVLPYCCRRRHILGLVARSILRHDSGALPRFPPRLLLPQPLWTNEAPRWRASCVC